MRISRTRLWIFFFVLVFLISMVIRQNRSSVESFIFTSVHSLCPQQNTVQEQRLGELASQEKIRVLKAENEQLKEQLGFIPEKADLVPVSLLWSNGTRYTLLLAKNTKSAYITKGLPVIYKDIFVGTVLRVSERVVLMQQANDATFDNKGITERGVKGVLKGGFGQGVFFEVPVDEVVVKGDRVYVLDEKRGWRFVVGTVESIDKQKTLPTQRVRIRYFAENVPPFALFIAL